MGSEESKFDKQTFIEQMVDFIPQSTFERKLTQGVLFKNGYTKTSVATHQQGDNQGDVTNLDSIVNELGPLSTPTLSYSDAAIIAQPRKPRRIVPINQPLGTDSDF